MTDLNFENPPSFNTIHLELTNACGYKCFCCPRDTMTRPVGFMSAEDIKIIAKRLDYIKNDFLLHMHGFGESLLVKDAPEKMGLAKELLPNGKIEIFSTLGVKVSEDYLERLIKNGLSKIHVSFYGYSREAYKNIHGVDNFEVAYRNLCNLVEINKAYDNKLEILIIMEDFGDYIAHPDYKKRAEDRERFYREFKDKGVNLFFVTRLHNYGGGCNFVETDMDFPCSVLWGLQRKILQVSWNLNVVPCCMIYDDEIILGNLRNQSIEEIYNSKVYKDFTNSLLNNQLDNYPTCKNCNKFYMGTPEERSKIELITGKKVPVQPNHKIKYIPAS